jgi:hypothetical protein
MQKIESMVTVEVKKVVFFSDTEIKSILEEEAVKRTRSRYLNTELDVKSEFVAAKSNGQIQGMEITITTKRMKPAGEAEQINLLDG